MGFNSDSLIKKFIIYTYRGYMYFGAAKDLPGVKELFEQEPPAPPRKTRGELMKDIDADYYGYRDDDDGVLIPLERTAERKGERETGSSYCVWVIVKVIVVIQEH